MTSIRSTDVPATILLVLCLCQLPISILTSLLILFSLFVLSPTPRKHDDGGCRGPPAQPDVYSVYPALYRTIYRFFCPPAGRPTPRTLFRTESRYPAIMVLDQSDSTIKTHRHLHRRHRNRRWAQSVKNRIFSYYWVPQSASASSSDPEAGCCTTRPTLTPPPSPHLPTISP